MTDRVSIPDLLFAVDWLGTYDSSLPGDDNGDHAARVIAWLEAEIKRRQLNAMVRETVKSTGSSPSLVRKAIQRLDQQL